MKTNVVAPTEESNWAKARSLGSHARLATMKDLREGLLKAWFSTVPCSLTLTRLFDENRIPRIKSNPSAKRGGGSVFWSVSHIEKMFSRIMLPGRLESAGGK